jgi:hypothetical protein
MTNNSGDIAGVPVHHLGSVILGNGAKASAVLADIICSLGSKLKKLVILAAKIASDNKKISLLNWRIRLYAIRLLAGQHYPGKYQPIAIIRNPEKAALVGDSPGSTNFLDWLINSL